MRAGQAGLPLCKAWRKAANPLKNANPAQSEVNGIRKKSIPRNLMPPRGRPFQSKRSPLFSSLSIEEPSKSDIIRQFRLIEAAAKAYLV